MTVSDIVRIMSTVAVTQCICDILSQRFIFSKEAYKRSVSSLERARAKRDKIVASASEKPPVGAKAIEKNAKKIQRAQDEFAEAAADVAKRHTAPNLFTSMVFLILYRVLSLEYSGKVIAVLPFQPWSLIRRLSMRGISIAPAFKMEVNSADGIVSRVSDPSQACAFMFIYVLSNLSAKFIVHKLIGRKPPSGADKGLSTMLDDPRNQKFLQGMGVDTEELKEVKKIL